MGTLTEDQGHLDSMQTKEDLIDDILIFIKLYDPDAVSLRHLCYLHVCSMTIIGNTLTFNFITSKRVILEILLLFFIAGDILELCAQKYQFTGIRFEMLVELQDQ